MVLGINTVQADCPTGTINAAATTDLGSGNTPRYVVEVSGIGRLMKNKTGSSAWSLSSGHLTTGSSTFALQTYESVTSIIVYGSGTGSNRTLSKVEVGTTTGNYATVTATAYTDGSDDGKFTTSGEEDHMRIDFDSEVAANSYVAITFSGNVNISSVEFVCAGPPCTPRTLSFAPAALSPTVGVATALPTANASAGTGGITYKMDGSALTAGQVSSYTFSDENAHTYSASIAASDGYCAASANMTITASAAVLTPQSITATVSASTAVANGLTTITLGNSGASGTGAVTYTITAPDATVSHGTSFVVNQVGTYTITASIAADATYAAATSASITVTGTACTANTVTLTLTSTSLDLDASETATLTAASATSGGAVTIGGTAGLTAVGQTFTPSTTGSFTVTGTVAASGSYCPSTATQTIAVTSASAPVCATYTATRSSATAATGVYSPVTFCSFTGFNSSVNTDSNGKLGSNGKYMGLTGNSFVAGDVITLTFDKATDLGNGMHIFAGTTASAANLIKSWTDGFTSGAAGSLEYTLTAADATKINAAGGVYIVRSSDYNQNPYMASMEVKRCKVCTEAEPSVVVNSATASFNAGCSVNLPASNLTIMNASSVEYSSSNPSVAEVSSAGVVTGITAGTATITATAKNSCDQCAFGEVEVTVGAGASYIVDATATVPNATIPATINLQGTSLANPVTVTVPAGITVTYAGTPHAGAGSFVISAANVNAGAELTISSSTVGDYNLGFSTTTACGTLAKTTAVTVRNVPTLPCPVLGEATDLTYTGATLNWTKLADETYVSNYRIVYYLNGIPVATSYANKGDQSLLLAGLTEGTTYTFRVYALSSDENSYVSSVGCAAGSFTTPEHPAVSSTACVSEGFESLTSAAAKPAADVENLTEIYTGSNMQQTNTFALPSGVWTLYWYQGGIGGSTYHGGSNAIRLSKNGTAGADGGYLIMPSVDNPVQFTFYVKNESAFGRSNLKEDAGLKIKIGSNVITSGVFVDDVEIPTVTRTEGNSMTSGDFTTLSSASDGCIDEDGNIKLFDTDDWHKISLDITSTSVVTIQLIDHGSRSHMWLDDFTVSCAAMEMTVTPAVTGLNYVPGLGPSDAKPFVLTGTGMPLSAGSGNVVMTATNGSYFEISTDGGSTFTRTASYNIPYNTPDFTKTLYVRLKDGLAEGSYSDNFTFTAANYTKQAPTMTAKGSVTSTISTIACGVTDKIAYLSAQDGSYTDRIVSEAWTASDASSGVTGFMLATNSTLTSPAIYDAANVQLEKLTFYYQPESGGNNTFSYRIYDGTSLVKSGNNDECTKKTAYPISIDISNVTITDYLRVEIFQGAKKAAEIWDMMVTASGKKDLSFSEPTMSLSTSQGCVSDAKMFKVYGTCLDEDSKVIVSANVDGKYEFSLDGSSWVDNSIEYTYAGEYSTRGTAFYVRIADDAPGGSSVDEIYATNNGKGKSIAYIVGDVTSSSSISPADGSVINITSTKNGEQVAVIPIVAGKLCNDLVVSTSCAGVTISDCYNGTFGSTATYSAVDSTRAIYLKFTPGSVASCTITMTSGASISSTFTVNFNANTITSPGHFDVNMAEAKDLTSSKFEFSLSDPAYEDFHAKTSFEAGDLVNTTLFVRNKAGVLPGDSETFTFGSKSVTITAQ